MLTRLRIRNFKLFDDVELELGDRVVLIGPNNAGTTTALQALALWDIGLKRWIETRGTGDVLGKRTGAAVNRRDLTAVPVPAANLLWRNRHVRGSQRKNIRIEIEVESIHSMSGLAANETRLDGGAVNLRLGEGRTAEGRRYDGEPSGGDWSLTMDESITEMEHALETLGKPAPWGPDIKASDDFPDRLFKPFYEKRALPNLMTKTDYHRLAGFVDEKHIDPEIREKLDAPADAAGRARPRKGGPV